MSCSTYDAVNGRQIYVNGILVPTTDPQKGGTISNWDSTFALVLGNEVSGDRSWQGLIKFVAIHSRAMSAAQVMQNFNAGVGERYYLLFNVSTVTGVSQSLRRCSRSASTTATVTCSTRRPSSRSIRRYVSNLPSIPVQGIRIGINGTMPQVGQAYIPLNTTITAANYTAQGEVLSNIGTVIGLQAGPLTDQFFLTFDRAGQPYERGGRGDADARRRRRRARWPPTSASRPSRRSIRRCRCSRACRPRIRTVNATYLAVQQQLPPTPTLEGFSSANQVGVAQLAIQYCNVAVNTPALQAQLFGVALERQPVHLAARH